MQFFEQCKLFFADRCKRNTALATAAVLICTSVLTSAVIHRMPQGNSAVAAEQTVSDLYVNTSANMPSEPALQDSSETAAILSESVGTNESKPVGCTHHYRIKVVSPTCTERGYTEHVCTVCGQRFSDAFTPAGHQYGKYLCEICGAPDPSVPLHSLCAWLRTYGTLNANGTYRSISYGDITIYTSEYFHDRDYIYIDKAVGTENCSEIFRIFFDSSGECTVLYSLSYPHSSVSASAAQSIGETGVLPITALEKYHNSTDNGKTQADYVQLLNRDLVPILKDAERNLLYPRTGLALKDLGFKL